MTIENTGPGGVTRRGGVVPNDPVNEADGGHAYFGTGDSGNTVLVGADGANYAAIPASGTASGYAFFPACKMFLRCRETSGNTMRNEISGTDLIVGASITRDGNAAKIVQRALLSQIPESFGNNIAAGTHTILAFAVVNPHNANGGFALGGLSNPNDHLHCLAVSESGVDITDDAFSNTNHVFTNDVLTLDVPIGVAVSYTPGSGAIAKYFQTNGSTWVTDSQTTLVAGGAGATTTLTPDFGMWKFTGGTVVNHYIHAYAAYVFAFQNGIPSDIEAALKWMTVQALAGTPAIYPGWIGRI